MPRDLSRSPSYRGRRSPSPRYCRRSRRDRSSSPYSLYSHSRRKSCSPTPRRRRSRTPSPKRRKSRSPIPKRRKRRSPTLIRRKSRSPTPRRHKRQRSRSSSLSGLPKSSPLILAALEHKSGSENLRNEDEEKKRRQHEAEVKLIEEETAKRVEEEIQRKVEECLNSDEIRLGIQSILQEGRKRLNHEVTAQLEKEREAALAEARQKEEQARKENEEMDQILEENRKILEEAQLKEALEQQRIEEERYRELEQLQRQKEEAMLRKKQEEEEERLNQIKLLGKHKSRPKVSFAFGSR